MIIISSRHPNPRRRCEPAAIRKNQLIKLQVAQEADDNEIDDDALLAMQADTEPFSSSPIEASQICMTQDRVSLSPLSRDIDAFIRMSGQASLAAIQEKFNASAAQIDDAINQVCSCQAGD